MEILKKKRDHTFSGFFSLFCPIIYDQKSLKIQQPHSLDRDDKITYKAAICTPLAPPPLLTFNGSIRSLM